MTTLREFVATWWPAVILLLGVGASTVRAESQNAFQDQRIAELYTKGSPAVADRLARIEERQIMQTRTLERIENRLDRETTR